MTKKVNNHNRLYTKIIIALLILTVAAIFLILNFALTKTTIKIFSQVENKSEKIIIPLQAENSENVNNEAILGKILNTELELATSIPSQSTTTLSESAQGLVTIYNNYSKDQTLVKTTRLLSSNNKIYRIQEKVNIPIGGSVTVWAIADETGTDSIMEPGKLTIPGLWEGLQDKIYAESKDGFKLESLPTYIVSAENLEQAKSELKKQATSQALDTINTSLSDNLKIDAERIFLKSETIDTSYIGQNSPTCDLKQKFTAYGLVFSTDDLKKMAENKFIKNLDSSQSLIEFLPEQFSYQISEIDTANSSAVIEVNLEAKINSNSKTWSIDKEKLLGLDETGIKKYLTDELNIDQVEVKFFPWWVKKAPTLKDHIIIE